MRNEIRGMRKSSGSRRLQPAMIQRAIRQNPAPAGLLTSSPPCVPFAGSRRATCVGCGCTDAKACLPMSGQPCHWLAVNYRMGIGVCSECGTKTNVQKFERRGGFSGDLSNLERVCIGPEIEE